MHVVRRDGDHLQVGVDPPRRVVLPGPPRGTRAARRPLATAATARPRGAALAADGRPAARRRRAGVGQPGRPGGTPGGRGAVRRGRRSAARGPRRGSHRPARARRQPCDGARPAARRRGRAWPSDDLPSALARRHRRRAAPRPSSTRWSATAHRTSWCVRGAAARGRAVRGARAHRLPALRRRSPRRARPAARAGRRAGGPRTPLADGASVDPALHALALAWAVRDLVRYVEGDRPATWSATVDIDRRRPAAVRRSGCGTRTAAAPGATCWRLS